MEGRVRTRMTTQKRGRQKTESSKNQLGSVSNIFHLSCLLCL
ncbi:unnamed protein product [Brassica rapa subsp. trilocularis]